MEQSSYVVGFDNKVVRDPKNKYFVVAIMLFYVNNHLPKGYTGPFFLKKALAKDLKERRLSGDLKVACLKRPFNKNTFEGYVKSLAKRCEFKDWKR